MAEIQAIPWNNLQVASTFSGCGGSCLGYRMAGFRVIWANEYDEPAQASYRLNHETPLDIRDIRKVSPESILEATGLNPGELDIFDGSPPCQGFSTAGKRIVMDPRNNLFHEYARILKGLQPRAFIAENVSGMVKGTMKGIFLEVLQTLKDCGYRVRCKILNAQWLGVPQQRQRAIFIGIREDLKRDPVFPKPLPYRYSVRDALPWIFDVRQSVFGGTDERSSKNKPCPSICASGGLGAALGNQWWVECREGGFRDPVQTTDRPSPAITKQTEKRKFTIDELKRICAFPDDFQLAGSYAQQWGRLGNSVPPVMMFYIASAVRDLLKSCDPA